MWHGEGEAVTSGGALDQLMKGDMIVFRYFLFTGGFKETAFTLDGAEEAIAEALGVVPVP